MGGGIAIVGRGDIQPKVAGIKGENAGIIAGLGSRGVRATVAVVLAGVDLIADFVWEIQLGGGLFTKGGWIDF